MIGVFITAVLFVAGIVYERRRQRAQEVRLYDETLYYLEQLLGRVVDWAGQLAHAYRSLAEGLRRAPMLPPEFGQYSDYAVQRVREIDRQVLLRAFLHRYGRSTATIDLYVGFYDALDYVIQQNRAADAARLTTLERRPLLEAQFRKAFDGLLTQVTGANRLFNASAQPGDHALAAILDAALPALHQYALPGTELEAAWTEAVQPLQRALHAHQGDHPQMTELLRRTQKLTTIRAALWQHASDAATRFALLGTSLQLGMSTLRSAQRRILTATAPPSNRLGAFRALFSRGRRAAVAVPQTLGE